MLQHFFALTVRAGAVWSLAIAATSTAGEPAPLPESTPWNVAELSEPPEYEWASKEGPVRSVYYRGLAYRGKPTQVFAYYASPATLGQAKSDDSTFPGVVLVHGGGGAAFSKWVEVWAKRGYAAIAMDLAGNGPQRKRLPDGGPDQSAAEKFQAIDEPVANQWSYHAVANVLLAHSLLASLDEVDAKRTAVTGISWGGYLTCIVAGVDSRFQAAVPVYGCGYLADNSCWLPTQFARMNKDQVTRWTKLWDPSRYIRSARMPVLFVNGTNDFAYPMDSYAKTCRLVQGEKNYSIQLRMRHGHLFDVPEVFAAIDQHLRGATPLPVVHRPRLENNKVTAEVTSETELMSARLHYTTGPHPENKARPWETRELEISGSTLSGPAPPENATVWYVDVRDKRDLLISSQIMLPAAAEPSAPAVP